MSSAAEGHATCCPSCKGSFDYRLDVNPGGGFRYQVSCIACGDVYYGLSTLPATEMAVAA